MTWEAQSELLFFLFVVVDETLFEIICLSEDRASSSYGEEAFKRRQ